MKLTEEQEKIIAFVSRMQSGQRLKVEAKAGSGKTSTLIEVAKANPDKQFLYLAFNKAIVNEAKGKFPPNVVVKTTHSLAYGKIIMPIKKKNRGFDVRGKITPFEMRDFFLAHKTDYERFVKAEADSSGTERNAYEWDCISYVARMYEAYLNSDQEERKQPKLFRTISKGIRKGELPYTHSFYLKEYHLLRKHSDLDRKYDFVLLDEAQDTNPVTMGIVNDVQCGKILVGDSNQSIYGFRGAINALALFDADATLYLTRCFRCNKDIVDRANYFLEKYDPSKKDFHPMVSNRPNGRSAGKSAAIIARTNSGLIAAFHELLPSIEKGMYSYKDVVFTRQPSEIFAPSMNVLKFKRGAEKRELDRAFQYFCNFDSIEALRKFGEDTFSPEIVLAIKLVESYEDVIFDLYERAKRCTVCDCAVGHHSVTLTTAHSSKGLEFDEVALLGDFSSLNELDDNLRSAIRKDGTKAGTVKDAIQALYEETNLYYVAMTRAKSVLFDMTENAEEYGESMRMEDDADGVEGESLANLTFDTGLFFLPEGKREEAVRALQEERVQDEKRAVEQWKELIG